MVTSGATSTSVQPQPRTSSDTQDNKAVEDLRPQLLEGESDFQAEPEENVPRALKSEASAEPAAKRA